MSEPVPQRIGDAERDRAAEYLREHLAQGRLTQMEFDERLTKALSARTTGDLLPLFVDLPAPNLSDPGAGQSWPAYRPPTDEVAPRPVPAAPSPDARVANALAIASAVMWPLYVVICFAIGWQYWWLCFIPIMISAVAGERRKQLEQERRRRPELGP